ncbi:DUF4198 domain-containing protein [Flavobacterium beibuense]|uniref:ABC-type Co2+ transport system, periplasmic component n=1 Tax=Flavobacterium beibuense TaxID=657326 RepID=A0A444W6A8_9FLAO|nr:DUF4198 domain-containing protein [Flavobacterium beibuense]RYJ41397.1 ABC-type Co2+ transport system, periplasmic component [Flavobacterium beibuense]
MKKSVLLLLLFMVSAKSFAHFMWVETALTGKVNQKQEVKVYFGEYTYNVIEKVNEEAFGKMKKFTIWVVSPNGEKQQLEVTPGETFFTGYFTPKTNGTYTVVLNNNEIDVIDYTQYDFGIFKTHYHSVAKVEVGNKPAETAAINPEGLTIVDITKKEHKEKGEATLKVLYKGEPVKGQEVTVFISDLWSKKVWTDENGQIQFSFPWKTKYILEVTTKEEIPGSYNGKEYQFIWHCATYAIPLG